MKKKFALLLVSVLIVSACVFSLAACDKEEEEDLFEKYDMVRFTTTYDYLRANIDIWDEERGRYIDLQYPYEQLVTDGDYILNYKDGDKGSDRLNGALLAARYALEQIGPTMTVQRYETNFSGTLGTIASDMIADEPYYGHVILKLKPTEQQKIEFSDPDVTLKRNEFELNQYKNNITVKLIFSDITYYDWNYRIGLWFSAESRPAIRQ